jgi:hypothetical protein
VTPLAWSPAALGDLRHPHPQVAAQVRDAIERYASTGAGDVAPLHGPLAGLLRLRIRGWRVFLRPAAGAPALVVAIEKHGDAHR